MIALLLLVVFLAGWTYLPAPISGGGVPIYVSESGTQSGTSGQQFDHTHDLSATTGRKLICASTSWNQGGNPATNVATMTFDPLGTSTAMTFVQIAESRYHHTTMFFIDVGDGVASGATLLRVNHTLQQDAHDFSCIEARDMAAGAPESVLSCAGGDTCSGNPITTVQSAIAHTTPTMLISFGFNIDNPLPTIGAGQVSRRHQSTAQPRTHSTTEVKTSEVSDTQLFTATGSDDMGMVGASWRGL